MERGRLVPVLTFSDLIEGRLVVKSFGAAEPV